MKIKVLTVVVASLILATALSAVEAIPANSTVFVGEMGGFGTYVMAAIQNKKVPLVIVSDKEKADFEIRGESESEKPGWARIIFTGQTRTNEQASINMVNIATGTVVFAYAANKMSTVHGKQSAAEACAKHLKNAMKKGG